MHVLYISYDGVTEALGQSQILPYLEGLSRRGIILTLVTFEKKEFFNPHLKEEIERRLQEQNIRWVSLTYHKRPVVLSTLFDLIYGLFISLMIIKNEKITIVHARSYVPSLIALLLKGLFKIKFIFDMRGFWADERVEGKIWKGKGPLYYFVKFLERGFLKAADEIVVLTNRAKEIIKEWGYSVSNISVIPCCVDTAYFKFDEIVREELRRKYNLDNKFLFIHAGSLESWYMKEEMLDYFKVACSIMSNAHFLILTHSDKKMFLRLISYKGLEPGDFTFLSVPYAEMPRYLSAADAGNFFITPVFSKLASSPTKFAEYLSCGLPVVINNKIGDLESYVEDNNIGVIINEFSDIEYRNSLKKLLNLLQDKELKMRCRQVALDNFHIDRAVEKYAQIYSR